MLDYKKTATHFHEMSTCPLIERLMERVVIDAYSRGIGVFTTTLMEDGKVSVRHIPVEDYVKEPQDAKNI